VTKPTCLISMLGCALGIACSNSSDKQSSNFKDSATLGVKQYVDGQLAKLSAGALAIQKAAPAPDDDGWDADNDAKALADMRKAWAETRDAYERVEGSIAVLFHELDVSTDERYDGFLADGPDDALFDDQGVTGVHAVERILWSDSIPQRVVDFESGLPGYVPAAFPSNKQEASEFKTKLVERLITDTKSMQDMFKGNALDPSSAFRGMIGSMKEQSEKTTLAASGEDESRYAQRTLADMRANLAGALAVFDAFKPWIKSAAGEDQDAMISAGFKTVTDAYAEVDGDALPAVPDGFNPDAPSDANLRTPYGKLWNLLHQQTDLNDDGSLVAKMSSAADSMGLPEFQDP
jgi:iron uptake system component EfeO